MMVGPRAERKAAKKAGPRVAMTEHRRAWLKAHWSEKSDLEQPCQGI